MAPNEVDVEWQTGLVIQYLFEDEGDISCRHHDAGFVEVDGPEDFDPVVIADKLRSIADTLNDDAKFQAALTDFKQAGAEEAVNAAFSHGVETLCQVHTAQKAEVAPEIQLIRASVAFGLYVKKSAPELKSKVQQAMTAFLNRNVGAYVKQHGGWDKVPDV